MRPGIEWDVDDDGFWQGRTQYAPPTPFNRDPDDDPDDDPDESDQPFTDALWRATAPKTDAEQWKANRER